MKKVLLLLVAVASSVAPVRAQTPAEMPRGADELQKQIKPVGGTTPSFKVLPIQAVTAVPRPVETGTVKPPPKKEKGPTEIEALEATFDQKTNQAVFIGEVVVKDPEFNVTCDKLTAHLKSAEAKPATEAAGPKVVKPATPAAAEAKKKGGGGGLERALAEADPGKRVFITQDKPGADGKVQRSTGEAERASYNTVTGDIVLTGSPEIQQGINRVVSTAPGTKMTLNRDGHMHAEGPHKTIIIDKGDVGL